MTKYALLAGLAGIVALSGCSKTADEPTQSNEMAVAVPNEAVPTAEADSPVGSYDVKMADGTMASTTINADGSYVDTGADGKVVKGTFVRKDGKDCFDPEGDAAEACWTVSPPAADGSFTATAPDGTTVTVTRKTS